MLPADSDAYSGAASSVNRGVSEYDADRRLHGSFTDDGAQVSQDQVKGFRFAICAPKAREIRGSWFVRTLVCYRLVQSSIYITCC